MRDGTQTVAWIRDAINKGMTFDMDECLQRCRYALNGKDGSNTPVPGLGGTAYEAWLRAGGAGGENTHTARYQVQGMPIFMKGAGHAGHICIYDTDGYVMTTDYPRKGRWNRVKLSTLAKAWNMKVLGGSETLNGVRVLPHKSY